MSESIEGRIVFPGNPWPEGHAIEKFEWSVECRGDEVWFHFHLETKDYYDERDIEDDESIEYPSDWEAPIVWGNYHSCTISSHDWHQGGFLGCAVSQFSPQFVDGLQLNVDPLPRDLGDGYETRAFHIYLLGHDAVADHRIKFSRVGNTGLFDIAWEGSIALAYAGDYELRYRFIANIKRVPFPAFPD